MGKKMYDFLRELGQSILNGSVKGDKEKEWTYTGGKRESVDYVLGNKETEKGVRRKRVEERIDSNRQLMTVWVEGRAEKKEGGLRRSEEERVSKQMREGKDLRNTLKRKKERRRGREGMGKVKEESEGDSKEDREKDKGKKEKVVG